MKKFMILLLGLLAFGTVSAQQAYPRDITLRWTNPSTYVGGEAILEGDLRGIVASCIRQDNTIAFDTEIAINPVVGSTQEHTFAGSIPQPGSYTCAVFAVTVDNVEGDPSNLVIQKYTGKPERITDLVVVFN